MNSTGCLFASTMSAPTTPATRGSMSPVSYTHLDVYKRQLWELREKAAAPSFGMLMKSGMNIGRDTVSYTHLQAAGTAIATVLSQAGAFFAAFFYMYRHREAFDFQLGWSFFRIRATPLKLILKMGVPQLARSFAVQGSMLWVKANINVYGLVPSSTYSIGNKIEKFMNVFEMCIRDRKCPRAWATLSKKSTFFVKF